MGSHDPAPATIVHTGRRSGIWPPDPTSPTVPPGGTPTGAPVASTPAEVARAETDDAQNVIHAGPQRPKAAHTMDELLPQTPRSEKNGYYHLGDLSVEKSLYPEFRKAMTALGKNPETADILENLEMGPAPTTVAAAKFPGENRMYSMGTEARVIWDPSHMAIATNGARHSPAVNLGVLLDRADLATHDFVQSSINREAHDAKYGNVETRRVIEAEAKNAHLLHESARDTGQHTYVPVGDVTSTTPVLKMSRDGGAPVAMPHRYAQNGPINVDGDVVTQDVGRGKTVAYDAKEFAALVGDEALNAAARDHKPVRVEFDGQSLKVHEVPSQHHAHAVGR